MKKLSTVALVTGLTLGLGSIAFAAEPAPSNGPNAKTNTEAKTPAQAQKDSNVNSKSSMGATTGSGATSGAMTKPSNAQEMIQNKNSQHQTINGGPAQGK